jgi:ABC-type Fe3+ transport system substrate-binding protein
MSLPARAFAAAAMVLAMVLGAAVAARADDDWQAGGGLAWQKVLAAARAEGKIIVAGTTKIGEPVQAAFKSDTGIDVEYLDVFSSELFARASREYKTGQVTMDAVFMGANGLPLALAGYVEPIVPRLLLPGATDPGKWTDGKLQFIDSAGTYMFVSSLAVSSWVLVDKNAVNLDGLTGWKDLLKPEYRGKIAIYDPHVAGTGANIAVFLAGTLGLDYVKALYVGQNPKISRDGRQIAEWVARGIYPIAIGALSEDVEMFRRSGIDNFAEVMMTDAPALLLGGYALHIPKGAPHPNAATVFANWLISRPGQVVYSTVEQSPSRRLDVHVASVPEYLYPQPGHTYINGYEETYLVAKRPTLQKAVIDILDSAN